MAITLSGTTITMNDNSTIVSTTTHQAIGSLSIFTHAGTSAIAVGSTVAGSLLKFTTTNLPTGASSQQRINHGGQGSYAGGGAGSGQSTLAGLAGSFVTGTWRNMSVGGVPARTNDPNEGTGNGYGGGLFARVS